MKPTIRIKAICFTIALIVAVSAAYTFEAIRAEKEIVRAEIVKRAEAITSIAAKNGELPLLSGSPRLLKDIASFLKSRGDVASVTFFDSRMKELIHDGVPFSGAIPRLAQDIPVAAAEEADDFVFYAPIFALKIPESADILHEAEQEEMIRTHIGWVRLVFSKAAMHKAEDGIVRRGVLLMLIFTAVSSFIAYLLISLATRPLASLATMANGIAEGDFRQDLPVQRHDEIGAMASAFLRMKVIIQQVLGETDALVMAVREGKLENRGNATLFHGEWRNLVSGVNLLAEAFSGITLELREAKSSLEQRVEERTAELALANRGLQAEIEERRRAEDDLRRMYERFSLATHAAQLGVWDWDIQKNKLVWDDSMYRLYSIQRGDFGEAYDAWVGAIHPLDRARTEAEIQAALRGEREFAPEFRIVRSDGAIRYIKANSQTFRDDDGKPVRMIGTNVDVTEQKQAEEKIRMLNQELEQRVVERTAQLEASNQELEAFCYTVSHDLRAPLRHIDGYVDLLVSRCRDGLSDKGIHYVDTIAASARQMGALIDDLLQFSRTGRAEMQQNNVDMNQLLREVMLSLREPSAGRAIDWIICELPIVRGDNALLRQVWANLLGNAVKYTRTRETARIEVSTREGDSEIIFVVEDNGVGFDMQYAGKLFGVFQRLHSQEEFEGTGIGLATVQRIITRHGGRVWAEAEPDKGATFYFSLPT